MMKSCLDASSSFRRVKLNKIDRQLLVAIGPGMIVNYLVHEDYDIPGKLSYTNEPGAPLKTIERHAMLLLGVRTEISAEGESQVFFVQNWTEEKQFIEFSADHLRKAEAQVYFLYKDQQPRVNNLAPRGHIFARGI
jgi:hypothetical protein